MNRLDLNKGVNSYMISMRKLPGKNSKYDPYEEGQSLETEGKDVCESS
jgi:hypothetical protein